MTCATCVRSLSLDIDGGVLLPEVGAVQCARCALILALELTITWTELWDE